MIQSKVCFEASIQSVEASIQSEWKDKDREQ
jgi:hypothetical protein